METLNIMPKLKHFPKDFDLDLALVILFTLLCIQTFLWKRKLYQKKYTFLAQVLSLERKCFGIRLSHILIVLSVFTISLAMGAYVRRCMILEGDRFVVKFWTAFKSMKEPSKTTDTKIDRILTVVLIISVILAISVTAYVIITPKEGEKFTEFYILGPGGEAEDYPTNLKVGEEGKVLIGVVNHEYANFTYQLEVRLNGEVIGEKSIELMHNETWENPFVFQSVEAGEDQKLEFLLYKEDKKEIYRTLHLWVDVT